MCLAICFMAGAGSVAAAIPKELAEAEGKYIESATERLSKSSDNEDAKKKLAALNQSFLKHLEGLHPKVLAVNHEGAADIEIRMRLMRSRLDSSLPLRTLDARRLLESLSGTVAQPARPAQPVEVEKPPLLGDQPTGELSCREEGKRVKVGESFEIKGRTKDVPDGFTVSVFGGKTSAGLFPRENRKDPNRRFEVRGMSSEAWLGTVEHLLMIVPEAAMGEIEVWYTERRRWESAGFPREQTPLFRGRKASNLYRDDFLKAGAKILAEFKMDYVR